ncbi:hypothetical protein TGRUB_292290 [Toxoplasma gondii RUB]|uniref:Uncharacterized protein n=1 Tax=Toxoplasma gondii RUB TaxID=935652 RepID=A0A086M219_TOXGO|nr:hypothetical protein TGRUB_292290 [Toxoplasma gondii RUB]
MPSLLSFRSCSQPRPSFLSSVTAPSAVLLAALRFSLPWLPSLAVPSECFCLSLPVPLLHLHDLFFHRRSRLFESCPKNVNERASPHDNLVRNIVFLGASFSLTPPFLPLCLLVSLVSFHFFFSLQPVSSFLQLCASQFFPTRLLSSHCFCTFRFTHSQSN